MAVKWARRMTRSNQYDGICHSLIPTPQMPDRPAECERLRGRDYHPGSDAYGRLRGNHSSTYSHETEYCGGIAIGAQ
jgi:hypothetical protein